ncbi:LOW QUALITY PROTEIN: hypothetical protein PHMEG_00029845 [Phytophthora megakarya]|uniref:Ty3 transposon capsid-like protein domain-containing protein n=1 Tax=Phytophthora megakarya TaxID=4795 RepID=A0A225V194_9STRA|nr:LOW QUALITY PROTEIN: hypothetical protein PHMEG_00029845 [Phytophthora megakarya]
MSTNAQLQAEIDSLNQAMAVRTRVPSNLPKFTGKRGEDVRECMFQIENACRIYGIIIEDSSTYLRGIAGSAMDKPASGWFLHWSSTTRSEEHTWGIFREHVLQHFEASNYQALLRAKPQRLNQTADIETCNGEYSALIFRVEGMSILDQVLSYANGLKPRTRSYMKLENPETLSEAMDLAVKYEPSADQGPTHPKSFKGKPFRSRGRFKPKPESKRTEHRTCHFCKKPSHYKGRLLLVEESTIQAGGRATTSVNEGPDVAKGETRALKFENTSLNVLCKNPLVYKSRPLFSVHGEISVGDDKIITSSMLLDGGATTIYVSKCWVDEHQFQPTKFTDKSIRVKLGDNQTVEAELEILPLRITVSGLDKAYECVAVVYAIPDKFDCILGIPFFEGTQPQIDWRSRRIIGTQVSLLHWERTDETSGPIEEGGQVIASGLQRGLSAKRPEPCRGAALETDVKSAVKVVRDAVQKEPLSVVRARHDSAPVGKRSTGEADAEALKHDGTLRDAGESSSARGNNNVVEKMFTMGVVSESGVQTKYITRKKLCKFLRIKINSLDEPDFMLVLSNQTIIQVARSLQRQDQSNHVGSEKALRYLETDWASFRENPAFKLLANYKTMCSVLSFRKDWRRDARSSVV